MATQTKAIKRRLVSVKNTRKITKAMELVAAAKMRKAVDAALGTREYAKYAWHVLQHIAESEKEQLHPLLETRPVENILVILVTSNRGLCGGLNSNIIRKTIDLVKNPKIIAKHRIEGSDQEIKDKINVEILSVGKKGEKSVAKMGVPVIGSYIDISDTPRYLEVQPIAQTAIEEYKKGKYDKVVIAYSDFVSAILQAPKIRQLLPISPIDLEKMILEMTRLIDQPLMSDQKDRGERKEGVGHEVEFTYEPGTEEVLNIILPRLVETQVYQSILESTASEHSARMMAMRNASDAASDMIEDLTFTLNRARQAGITQEIAEISSGMAALS